MGQENVKRGLEIAAAGSHNVLLIGSPGSGKSMLSRRLPSILPDMTREEALEVTKVYSVAGLLEKGRPMVTQRPFRSPHHTVSAAGLAGGGRTPVSYTHLDVYKRQGWRLLLYRIESEQGGAACAAPPCKVRI